MKKYFLLFLLAILITPTVSFAAWWNPFIWRVFQKKQTTSQMVGIQNTPEEKIIELQKELDQLKKQSESKPAVVPTETKKLHSIQSSVKIVPKKVDSVKDVEVQKQVEPEKVVSNEEKWCSEARVNYREVQAMLYEVQQDIYDLQKEREKVRSGFVSCGTWCNSELFKIDSRRNTLDIKESAIKQEQEKILKDVAAYCG